jgi:hypothetical protein
VKQDVAGPGDLLFFERAALSFELGEESTLAGGLSALFGPNATGGGGDTQILGADLFYRWRPLANDQGWPFLQVQGEAMGRRYHAASFFGDFDGDGNADDVPYETFEDVGFYAQALWGFERPWAAGLRVDWVDGDGASTSGIGALDRRVRVSPNLTYYPSEFSRIRLQVNWDRAQELRDREILSVWLQFEILFGAHGAHRF